MSDFPDLRVFGGEVPVSPEDLLPGTAAQQALFCDFTHGHLMPLRQGLLLTTMSAAVKTIYTEDGLNFYTWGVETSAAKSPVLADVFNRVYYLDSGVLRATTTAGMLPTGGVPALSYKVGVPAPATAPALAIVERSDLRDYPGATVAINLWYEYDSDRYQETTPSVTTVTAFRTFTVVAPALSTPATPAGAVLRATLKFINAAGTPFMTITLTAGDTDARSTSLPGNVTLSMISSGTTQTFSLLYGVSETRAYVSTCVNTWKEESGPSPASQIATTYMEDVAVTLSAVDFTGYRPLDHYTTYRTMGASASYLDVHEGSSLTFTDISSKAADVLGALATLDYELPPAALDVFIVLSTGVMMGFHGNMLYMSDPYRPHTWQYQQSFRKNVRSICEAPQCVVLTTAEGCYIVVGTAPASMQAIQLPQPQAGIAQRSIVELDSETVFASNDGIVSVKGSSASLASSQNLFARDDWQARYGAVLADASLRFGYHDGCLVGVSSSQALGFVIRLDEKAAGQYTQFNEQFDSMFHLPVADTLYYSKGAAIYQFRGGDPYSYTWWSREWTYPAARNFGAFYIRCSAAVTLSIYMDGVLWWTGSVTTGVGRLPPDRAGHRFSFKFEGSATIKEFRMARTPRELNMANDG